MQPLVITIRNVTTGEQRLRALYRSPLPVGRHEPNDLPLPRARLHPLLRGAQGPPPSQARRLRAPAPPRASARARAGAAPAAPRRPIPLREISGARPALEPRREEPRREPRAASASASAL